MPPSKRQSRRWRCRSRVVGRASKARMFDGRDAGVRAGARPARGKGSRGNRMLSRPPPQAQWFFASFCRNKKRLARAASETAFGESVSLASARMTAQCEPGFRRDDGRVGRLHRDDRAACTGKADCHRWRRARPRMAVLEATIAPLAGPQPRSRAREQGAHVRRQGCRSSRRRAPGKWQGQSRQQDVVETTATGAMVFRRFWRECEPGFRRDDARVGSRPAPG